MIKYVNENVNPKNKKTCDCVIRAITKATGKDYYVVYEELYKTSVKSGFMLNEKRVEEKVLEKYGFVKIKQPRHYDDNTKYTIGEIDELISKNDIVIISCAHHLTCVKNHTLYDIWDCRNKTIGNYYVLKGV